MPLTIPLPDGSQRSVAEGTPVRDFAAGVLPLAVVKKGEPALVDVVTQPR